jgi:hypothetical protein
MTGALQSYFESWLPSVTMIQGSCGIEIVSDNAIVPTRTLRQQQKRRRHLGRRPTSINMRLRSRPNYLRSFSTSSMMTTAGDNNSSVTMLPSSSTNDSFRHTPGNDGNNKKEKVVAALLEGDDEDGSSPRCVLNSEEEFTILPQRSARWRPAMVRQWSDSALLNPKRVLL